MNQTLYNSTIQQHCSSTEQYYSLIIKIQYLDIKNKTMDDLISTINQFI